jgi:glycosyltransferase involved in cell wall biosynthesis
MSAGSLTIGIDGRELLGETTGVGRYLGELLSRWVGRADAASRVFLVYTPEPLPFLRTLAAGAPIQQVVIGSGAGTWWEQTHLRRAVRADAPDVFFAPAYTAPLGLRMPLVVTIHDVSFAAHPEWYTPREGARRRLLTRQAARSADLILTDSEFSRREIIERLSAEPERLRVIPPGVSRRSAVAAPARRTSPVVLFAGSIFNRRRLPETIAAFAEATIARPDARLIIAGADRSYPPLDLQRLAVEVGAGSRVEIRRYVSDLDLAALYAEASVFVFLSEYEGFGLTPLEALSAGVPIVVLDTPISREVYGDAAWYVNPDDTVRGAAHAMSRLLNDPSAATDLLAHAPAVLKRYSWNLAADHTLTAITRVGDPA